MASVDFETPVQYLKGVGPRRAGMLEKAGIHNAGDLLRYLPFRYEDRSEFVAIRALRQDCEAVIRVTVLVTGGYSTRQQHLPIFELIVRDATGSLSVKFFNQGYLSKVFKRNQVVVFFGVPTYDKFSHSLCMLNPEFEIVAEDGDLTPHSGRITPVYRRIGQITTRVLREILFRLIEQPELFPADPLPGQLIEKYGLTGYRDAIRTVHFPEVPSQSSRREFLEQLQERRTPAHRRLAFEEFFIFQIGLQLTRLRRTLRPKMRRITVDDRIRDVLRALLPFRLTPAQKRVAREVVEDLQKPGPMCRLLQGDVGSGKTIVALLAMVVVAENAYQACLMAPTELLAEQHFRNFSRLLGQTGHRVEILTSAIKGSARSGVLEGIASGSVRLVIGTHALIQEEVRFNNLALAVIDEQHRFGVMQRSLLVQKAGNPDLLVMTATPIPRSLALTLYGDLSVSVIDHLPPGRVPVQTVIKGESGRSEVWEALRKLLAAGRQAYVIYPLIEESEKVDLKAASEMSEHLAREVFPEFQVGLMHGRLKPAEKDALMDRFVRGEVQILVSTTVIEVGIDVPNASVMVIEHSERFGLSQLHQLRGRIGRGTRQGLCILMVERASTPEARKRLGIMRKSTDGFEIAEKDLEIRGPGEFVGTRQSGIPEFVFGNIIRDRDLLEAARSEAEVYVSRLVSRGEEAQREIAAGLETWKQRFRLFHVG